MAQKPTSLEKAIQDAAERFAEELMTVIRSATVEELAAIKSVPKKRAVKAAPAKRRGRPPKVKAEVPPTAPKRRGRPPKKAEPVARAEPVAKAEPVKKARKKRTWPNCTVKGCTKNVYMPSGSLKMCYAHYLEAGGKESPLVKYRKGKAKKKPAKKPAAKK